MRHKEKNCLLVLGSIMAASRTYQYGEDLCLDDGGGSVTDISSFQGWLKCSFKAAGAPLDYLKDDASGADCFR